MTQKQTLKLGEKLLFGIFGAFLIFAIIGYGIMEYVRLNMDKPMFTISTHFDLSAEGKEGEQMYNKSGCSTCHRVMQSGTNMGLSLDGLGSKYKADWIYEFLRDPEKAYKDVYHRQTFDHAVGREAGYVAQMPDKDLRLITTFLSELKSDRGSSSAPLPPEGRSEFIDKMIGTWAPESWKKNYKDIRTKPSDEGTPAAGDKTQ